MYRERGSVSFVEKIWLLGQKLRMKPMLHRMKAV